MFSRGMLYWRNQSTKIIACWAQKILDEQVLIELYVYMNEDGSVPGVLEKTWECPADRGEG